jgi:hypothetical protein
MLFGASPVLAFDVVLGANWIAAVRASFTSVGLRDPTPDIYN